MRKSLSDWIDENDIHPLVGDPNEFDIIAKGGFTYVDLITAKRLDGSFNWLATNLKDDEYYLTSQRNIVFFDSDEVAIEFKLRFG